MLKLILPLLLSFTALAQQQRVIQGEIMEGQRNERNYIKNPSCLNNTAGIATTAGTATISQGTGGSGSGRFSKTECVINVVNPNSATVEFDTYTMETKLHGQNCEVTAHIAYTDTSSPGTNIFVRAVNANGLQTPEQTITPTSTSDTFSQRRARKVSIVIPCGDAATGGLNPLAAPKLQIRAPLANLNTRIYVSDVTSGEVTSIGQFSAVSEVIDAGTSTIGAVTTPPTKGTTSVDKVTYYKMGRFAVITWDYRQNGGSPAAGSGDYLWTLPSGLQIDTTHAALYTGAFAVTTAMQSRLDATGRQYSSVPQSLNVVGAYPYTSTQIRVAVQNEFVGTGFIGSGLANFSTSDYGISFTVWVPIQGWSASQSAAAADQTDYGRTLYTPTFTGFGTVVNPECYHSRKGEFLYLDCKFTGGTTAASEGRVSLPNNLVSTAFTQGIRSAGTYFHNEVATSHGGAVLIESSIGYVTFGSAGTFGSLSVAPLTKANGQNVISTGQTMHFTATIPIQGWAENQRAPTLIGSVTSNSAGALRIEGAQVAANGTVSNETSDWINGNCTNANPRVCTLVSGAFSVAPICTVTSFSGGSANKTWDIQTLTTSTFTVVEREASTGTSSISTSYNVLCMGPR